MNETGHNYKCHISKTTTLRTFGQYGCRFNSTYCIGS